MTRTNWARLAGLTFLLYIVFGISQMVLFGDATNAQGTAAKLSRLAANAATVRLVVLFSLLTFANAVALAVALYALTREQDQNLATMALCFRVSEGILAAIAAGRTLGLLEAAIASTTASGQDAAAAIALGASLLKQGTSGTMIAATCFAWGSTLYCYLFLRARTIPLALSWLGLAASGLLTLALPLQVTGYLTGPATSVIWIPMLLFEVPFALWLLIRGTAEPNPMHRNNSEPC